MEVYGAYQVQEWQQLPAHIAYSSGGKIWLTRGQMVVNEDGRVGATFYEGGTAYDCENWSDTTDGSPWLGNPRQYIGRIEGLDTLVLETLTGGSSDTHSMHIRISDEESVMEVKSSLRFASALRFKRVIDEN